MGSCTTGLSLAPIEQSIDVQWRKFQVLWLPYTIQQQPIEKVSSCIQREIKKTPFATNEKMFHPRRYRGRGTSQKFRNMHSSTTCFNCGTGNSSQWRYFGKRKFCNTCVMKRYRQGCLHCSASLPNETAALQPLNGMEFCKKCDLKICLEMDLAEKVLMYVFTILRSEEKGTRCHRQDLNRLKEAENDYKRSRIWRFVNEHALVLLLVAELVKLNDFLLIWCSNNLYSFFNRSAFSFTVPEVTRWKA